MREHADIRDQIRKIKKHIRENPEEIDPPPVYFWGKVDALYWVLNSDKPLRPKNPNAAELVTIPW